MTTDSRGAHAVGFEVYGIHARIGVATPDLLPRVAEQLPLHATRCEPRADARPLALEISHEGVYVVLDDGAEIARTPEIEEALATLRRQLFFLAVDHARDHLVVSAGVVGYEGRAIVLPGPTAAGKTQLVVALLRAGADYYTDDWAVLDGEGRAHPYPGLLFIKNQGRFSAESFGAARGDAPIPVGTIAQITYEPEGRWQVRSLTAASGVMMLIGHAYGLDDPRAAMRIAQSAAEGALVVKGERGEADEAAAELLELAAQTGSGGPA